ncbi:MAG: 1-acyl-sn-glycerol-3-phosphate acyltransferase [Oscillospiraceae bacterium]|nr:1-acyl-sn-glycerol-3-phosphate acyltransferase [Oscillospiraceae bacterium]
MKGRKRHIFVWGFLRWVVPGILRRRFNYSPEICPTEGPCLVLCNHNTDWDPILLGYAFPQQMYFVASEHVFRWGFVSGLLRFFFDPIARLKGTTAGDTVMTIMRRIKEGCSVAIFAEGNRSFNGLTGEILPSTGKLALKLAKMSNASLVTYRISGGYLSSPRWAGNSIRRGKMTGKVMGIYSPETLKAMKPAEVSEIIERDLFVDAYAEQRENPVRFIGKNLAEGLSNVLCLCPRCGKIGSLEGKKNSLSCDCGFSVTYNEYGLFEGAGAPADNITDWDRQQTEALLIYASACEGEIFSDEGIALTEVTADHGIVSLGSGKMSLTRESFSAVGKEFPLGEITGFALHGKSAVNLSVGEKNYEIVPLDKKKPLCTRKYMTVINYLKNSSKAAEE